MTRIKFCGFTREEDVAHALELKVDAIGVVRERTSKRYLKDQGVLDIVRLCGPLFQVVSVYGKGPGPLKTWRPLGTNLVQAARPVYYFDGRPPQIRSLRLTTEVGTGDEIFELGSKAIKDESCVGLLLDAHDDNADGGTGKKVDWTAAAEFVQLCNLPVILAGGLTPDNVGEAIRTVRPYAVDVSSGIEVSPGIKDPAKMKAFVEAVRATG